jgi:hypothetical protein
MEGMNLPCQANEMTGQWHDTTRSFSREVASSAHRIVLPTTSVKTARDRRRLLGW